MVGRAREFAVATALLDQLDGRPGGGVLFIVGEPGIGKTTLLAAIQHEARGRSHLVRSSRCLSMATPLPLEPVVDLLLPDDNTQPSSGPAPPSRERYADALRALRVRASTGPTVLLLDDLQWSDHATLAFLQAAITREEPGAVLWILAARPGEVATTMTDTLHRLPHATTLTVAGLEVDDVADLARTIADPPGDDVVAAIHHRTGGNPFLALELLRAAADPRPDRRVLPAGVRDAVAVRRRDLGEPADTVLGWCAVLPDPIHLEWLGDLCGLDALASVATLVDGAFLTSDSGGEGVRFVHDLLRDAVLDALPGPTRRAMHARVAEALRTASPELRAVQLRAAGRAREAAGLYVELADAALLGGAPADASDRAREAGSLARDAGDRPLETAALGLEVLAKLRLGEQAAAHELARRVRRRLRDRPASERARFLARYAMACWDDTADLDRAQDAVAELAPLEAALDGADAAEALLARAHITNRAGRSGDALPVAREAVRLARAVSTDAPTDAALLPRALGHLGLLEGQAGSITAAVEALEEAVDLAQDHGLPAEEGYAWLARSFLAQHTGDEDAHEQLARRGLEVAGLPAAVEAMLRANAGVGAVWRGDVSGGLLELEQALEVGALAGRATRNRVAVTLVHALARHGEVDQADALLAEIDAPPGSWEGTRVAYARALVAEEGGDDATARVDYLAGCADGDNPSSVWSLAGVVRTSCALGDVAEARQALTGLEQRAARWPVVAWLLTASQGEVADLSGDRARAAERFAAAAAARGNRGDQLRLQTRAAIAQRDAPATLAALTALSEVVGSSATARLRARATAAGLMADSDAPRFELRILGPLELLHEGAQVKVPTGRPVELLGLLALTGPQPTARVIDALWPHAPEQSGRQRLRQVRYRLRQVAPDLVVRGDDDRIALGEGTQIDLDRFETLATRPVAPDDDTERSARAALALVRGEVLEASELELDDLEATRERVRVLRRGLHDQLGRLAVARGDLTDAVDELQASIELDQTDQTRVRRLERILRELERHVEADGLLADTVARLHALGVDTPTPRGDSWATGAHGTSDVDAPHR